MGVRGCPAPWACAPWRAFWALVLALALPFSPGVSLFRGGSFPPSHGRIPADGVPMLKTMAASLNRNELAMSLFLTDDRLL